MTTYRAIVSELDYAMKMDSNMGYFSMVLCTAIIMTQLGYSIFLNF